MEHRFLIHKRGDHVGVAVADIAPESASSGSTWTTTRPSRSRRSTPFRSDTRSRSRPASGRRGRGRVRHPHRATRPTRLRRRRARAHPQPEERPVVTVDGLPARERPRRRPQPRRAAPGRRPLERCLPVDRGAGAGHARRSRTPTAASSTATTSSCIFRTMIGTGANPNVAAAIVIGIEPNWTARIAEGIAATGKPVEAFSIEGNGDLEVVRQASHAAQRLMQHASELRRETGRARRADRQHQVRRVRHDDRSRLVPDGRRRRSTRSSTRARPCCSARRPS